MRFEELEKADVEVLKRAAKRCLSDYNDPNTGGLDKPALLLEAQFYINELDRRHAGRIALRDLILEVIVILLIGGEIALGIYGTRLAIKQGNDQDGLMTKQMEVLN